MTDSDRNTTTRSEEELRVGRTRDVADTVGVHKRVESSPVEREVPRRRESVRDIERSEPLEEDSGEVEVLEDGSVSVPVLEEQLVVSRRVVVRERVIIRKVTETQIEKIRAELQRERIEIRGNADVLDDADVRSERR